MSHYILDDQWLIIKIDKPLHTEADIVLLSLIRSLIFRQMLEPPRWDGTYTVIEGRYMLGAERRLKEVGIHPLKKVYFGTLP